MSIEEFQRTLVTLARALLIYHGIAEASEKSGWLPYHTVPFKDYFSECGSDISALTDKVSDYYREHSQEVLLDVESKLTAYTVDDEAKETLAESLKVHSCGFYRSCCRLLLPEIERVLREDWLGISHTAPLGRKALKEKVNQYHLDDFVLDEGGLVLFGKIFKHLFEWFDDIADPAADTTPNRHGATHGWAIYSTEQHSLNTIICADYVFRVVTAFKGRKGKSA